MTFTSITNNASAKLHIVQGNGRHEQVPSIAEWVAHTFADPLMERGEIVVEVIALMNSIKSIQPEGSMFKTCSPLMTNSRT
jgi:hypothetical protein